jgi:hypothetical protein
MQGESKSPDPLAENVQHMPSSILVFEVDDELVGITDQA